MKKSPQEHAHEIFLLNNLEEKTIDDLLPILRAADDSYYNKDGESFISDEEYDTLRRFAQGLDPNHSYFLGVGSEVRGGKVKLPFQMGSLDQIYEGEITEWVGNWMLQDLFMVLTDKLDGTSALILYDEEGNLQIAYSRGDGVRGADITRHIRRFTTIPNKIDKKYAPMAVRGEVILSRDSFLELREEIMSRSGKPYKNARNMTAGLMNAEKNNPLVYDALEFLAYKIYNYENGMQEMLTDLQKAGFSVPHYDTMFRGQHLTDSVLSVHLERRRDQSVYEIDGLVIDVDDPLKRRQMNPTRETLNPACSVKYKVADASNLAVATVEGVKWAVSKSGYLKPTIQIEPVDLVGVTVSNCTGFNAKFIHDNKIGKGAKIQVTRSGDVIPFCQAVLEGTEAEMPTFDWKWNETEVDAVVTTPEEHEEIIIQQVLDYFRTLDVPMLKEGNIREMFAEHSCYGDFSTAAISMSNYDEDHWFSCIGANGYKIYEGLRKVYTDVPLWKLMGATPFFGRGVGTRKFKKLLKSLQVKSVEELPLLNKAQIVSVDGFEDKTATKIVAGMDKFIAFINKINNLQVVVEVEGSEGVMKDQKVVFTGFRNKSLQALVEAEGGTMQSSVSGKTTILVAKDPNSNSGKMKKARDKGVRVMGIEEFRDLLT